MEEDMICEKGICFKFQLTLHPCPVILVFSICLITPSTFLKLIKKGVGGKHLTIQCSDTSRTRAEKHSCRWINPVNIEIVGW